MVVAVGTSKAGKSRALLEALKHCTRGKKVDLVAPCDGDALRSMLVPGQAPEQRTAVLWLDDIEPFLGDNVTVTRFAVGATPFRQATSICALMA